jgi:two-component system, cell cycle sensor histidine kinase and response regulator CckA
MPAEQITILIAEDDTQIRDLLKKILQNYHLLVAADGKEALELAERHNGPIELLLSDIVMPELSGVELARAITAKHPETKVVLTSAYSRHIWVMDQRWQLIAKPYLPTELLEIVTRAVQPELGQLGAREVA